MDDGIVVTALDAGTNSGKLLRRVEDQGQSVVIGKRGRQRVVLLSIRDYARLAVPEPEVLWAIGMESKRKGTNRLNAAPNQQDYQSCAQIQTPMIPLRLVIDTNIVVAAALKPKGCSGRVN